MNQTLKDKIHSGAIQAVVAYLSRMDEDTVEKAYKIWKEQQQ